MIGEINCVSIYLYRSERVETQAASDDESTEDYTLGEDSRPASGEVTPLHILDTDEEIDMQRLADLEGRVTSLTQRLAESQRTVEGVAPTLVSMLVRATDEVRGELRADINTIEMGNRIRDSELAARIQLLENSNARTLNASTRVLSRLDSLQRDVDTQKAKERELENRMDTEDNSAMLQVNALQAAQAEDRKTIGDLSRDISNERTERRSLQQTVNNQGLDISSLRGDVKTLSEGLSTSVVTAVQQRIAQLGLVDTRTLDIRTNAAITSRLLDAELIDGRDSFGRPVRSRITIVEDEAKDALARGTSAVENTEQLRRDLVVLASDRPLALEGPSSTRSSVKRRAIEPARPGFNLQELLAGPAPGSLGDVDTDTLSDDDTMQQ